jgi:hypothetical protein
MPFVLNFPEVFASRVWMFCLTTNDTATTGLDHNASLNDSFCTKLDDLILNMRDDEALDRKGMFCPLFWLIF